MVSNQTRVEKDGLGDWRLQAVTTLAADMLPAHPGGLSHKAGSRVSLVTTTHSRDHGVVAFETPNATALALNIAFEASRKAVELYPTIQIKRAAGPGGPIGSVTDVALLFEYFEHCLVAVTFSFQALETFANLTITWKLEGTMTVDRQKGAETLTAAEIERKVSTEEKLATILPAVLTRASPKGRKEWQRFVSLKEARDATIHLKSSDQYPPDGHMENDSLFYHFFNSDVQEFPRSALAMIWYFRLAGEDPPRWLNHLVEKHGTGSGKALKSR